MRKIKCTEGAEGVEISYRDRNFLNDMMSGCYIGFTEEECTLFHEKNMTELTELGYIS